MRREGRLRASTWVVSSRLNQQKRAYSWALTPAADVQILRLPPSLTENAMPAGSHVRTTNGRGRLFDSVLDTVGDTPCVRINNLAPKGMRMYVKIEAFNPAASVKDRLRLTIIQVAQVTG